MSVCYAHPNTTIMDKSPWDNTAIFIFFCQFSWCPHKIVTLFEIFLQFSFPPPYTKLKLEKKTLDTCIQHCLWGDRRGWTCVNWKMTQKCKVSQEFCPAGLYFKCFCKKRFTNSLCSTVIDLRVINIINSFSGIIMDVKLLVSQSQPLSTGALFKE